MATYYLQVKFGDTRIPCVPPSLKKLVVIQDINRFLPEFRIQLEDNSGLLTHIVPFDRKISKVTIEFSQDVNTETKNSFEFMAWRRKPEGEGNTPAGVYDVVGMLNIDGLFAPDYSRGWNQSIKTTLEDIATQELQIENTDISSSLSVSKNIIQPQWSNVQLLKWLKTNLVGNGGECSFKCFVKCEKGKQYFVFKSLEEFIKDEIKYKFILHDQPYQDQLPVYKYRMFDNYKVFGAFASKKQGYGYFDYDTGEYVEDEYSIEDLYSLTDYYLVDKNDSEDSATIVDNGSNNDFTSDFKGRIKGAYYDRTISLSQMWITTQGIPDISPGHTVQMFFPHGTSSAGIYSYQYSGYWLVERVVHNIGDVFTTQLLLTRNGVDTDKSALLLKASSKKRK